MPSCSLTLLLKLPLFLEVHHSNLKAWLYSLASNIPNIFSFSQPSATYCICPVSFQMQINSTTCPLYSFLVRCWAALENVTHQGGILPLPAPGLQGNALCTSLPSTFCKPRIAVTTLLSPPKPLTSVSTSTWKQPNKNKTTKLKLKLSGMILWFSLPKIYKLHLPQLIFLYSQRNRFL